MGENRVGGYAGRLLRVDLAEGKISDVTFDEATLRKWVGGSGLGAKIMYEEVPPSVQWDDPENRLILATGPLGGTRVMGTGTFSVITVGALTGGSVTSQANGFMGAFMKFAGCDGVVFQGRSERWVYLYLHDGVAELRDATHLLGLDTWEMHDAIAKELGKSERAISVFGIGPAGEHLARFAAIAGDRGHVAGHNGTGAVMGSKRVKAVVAARGPRAFPIADESRLTEASKRLVDATLSNVVGQHRFDWGTSQSFPGAVKAGYLPIKNYTTSLFPQAEDFLGAKYRPAYRGKPAPCWACRTKHLHLLTIPDGPYAGFKGEEPEYEQWAAWGPVIGNTDVAGAMVLANETDRLGFDNNESGWLIGWVMECYERGILTKEDTGGLEMTWGNVEAVRAMLRKIAHREGIGDLLAEGVKRASEKLGRGSQELAVYTLKGNSPRGHDHRARWTEMLDTCTSDTGTIGVGPLARAGSSRAAAGLDPYDPQGVAEATGRQAGRMIFEDCLGGCRFTLRAELSVDQDLELLADVVSATTGWDFTGPEGMEVGKRTLNLLRAFNLKRGLTPAVEYPSKRYGSVPVDGPVAGKGIGPHWEEMRGTYYRTMGWDPSTGRPLPETLEALGLGEVVGEVWGDS